jgi:hypothetical protein
MFSVCGVGSFGSRWFAICDAAAVDLLLLQ